MPDNVIKIGAIVSTDGLQEGVATTTEAVKAGVKGMTVSFQEMSTQAQASALAANRAFTSISDDTKAAAAGLSEQALKEATLAKARIAANLEVRTSIKLMNNEQFDQAKATELYAASTQKVVALDAEIVAAHKEAARAAAEAAEEAKLSSNVWIASMQRVALSAKESFGEVQEMMAGTVERAGITASGIRFGFAGISEALGGALIIGFAGEFLDDLAKMNNELDHLSVKTGINITSLAGLEQIVQGMGGEFEPVSNGLVRLARAQIQATEGSKTAQLGFKDLGITMQEVEHLSPEQMLYRVSRAIAENGSNAVIANSAITLFGRGGAALIPVLREQGANLEKNMKLQGEATGITEQSAAAARRWSEDLARLTAELRSDFMPLLEIMPDILRGIEGDFLILKALMQTVFEGIATSLIAVVEGIGGLSKVLSDITVGDFAAVVNDSRAAKDSIVDMWKSGIGDIKNAWKSVGETFTGAVPTMPSPKESLGGSDLSGLEQPDKHAAQKKLKAMEEELNQLKLQHQVTIKEEYDFWAQRINAFARGSEQYDEIVSKMAAKSVEGARQTAEAIKKFKTDSLTRGKGDVTGDYDVAATTAEINKQFAKQAENVTQSGESWKEYWSAVARGQEIEASMKASLEETRIRILESAGGITELGAAQAMARIHTEEHTRALKALQEELAALEKQAAASAKDPVTGALLDGQLAGKMQTVQNQILQQKGQGANQGAQDTAAINAAVAKPYLKAFNTIEAGWKKVQTDLIAGNKNIARDFAQMGVGLVQSLAQNFEQILAKHARMWIQMQITHATATEAGVATDAAGAAQSVNISMLASLKKLAHSAAVAAGKAWSAFADIPIVGPELGAIAAAATYAGVMALAAFEKGGVVGGQAGMAVPILAHSGERVLTSSQTNNFERMVNQSQTGGSQSIRAHVTQNFGSQHSASSAKETQRAVKGLMRRGKLAY